ncbi:RDD family protein [Nocardia sp. NPDC050717]|uniref:RDD family protein n=1 Tax=Nocardia sp. NPDC050717 TaxID=3157221 RepID=UPI0033DAC888
MTTGGFEQVRGTWAPAGLGGRAAARFIDWIIAGIVGGIVFWVLERVADLPGWLAILPGAGFGFLYFVFFEVVTGSTPGKKILGLRVIGADGVDKPSVVESAKRNAYMLFNLIPWVGGLLWFVSAIAIAVTVSSSSTKQGWHDNFAGGTRVVKA